MDTWVWIAVIIGIILLIAGIWWIVTARRLDRLHRGLVQVRTVLRDALATRSRLSLELAATGAPDIVGSILLADVAERAERQSHRSIVEDGLDVMAVSPRELLPAETKKDSEGDRHTLESDLSRTLRLVVDEAITADFTPEQSQLLTQLNEARQQIRLARRFHNLQVDQTRRVRSKAPIRLFHIAGSAPMPRTVDIDDA